ncbi:hypothetical protein EKH79_02165 [Dyella dinghuensis]|uniref:Uncharacterized protein n=1 Tax=Dyella dinghuensis TaxID=1920169 RepID=A0A432LX48_9GAMM|nr:hypothetical protein [Dyella dinghuensis]RUL66644.1 hypothetical protein EKH79_02165 [Dyella dinghuensis]
MRLQEELSTFYAKNGFGNVAGARPLTVPVYTGCLLVPLPNIETRRRYLKYHDLHHLITGYSVGRIGEGEVSAWELGTGSALASPTLAFMNLIALSTGLVLQPRRMWNAFVRGTRSKNLYAKKVRADVDAGEWENVEQLRQSVLDVRDAGKRPAFWHYGEFGIYASLAMVIHAGIAIPAVVTRLITDMTLGYSFFQAVKPKKRVDLF